MQVVLYILSLSLIVSGLKGKGISNVETFFLNFDKELTELNSQIAELAWDSMLEPSNINKQVAVEKVANEKIRFVNRKCRQMLALNDELDATQERIYELTCTGLKFDESDEQRRLLELSSMIQYVYTTTKLCIPKTMDMCINAKDLWNFTYIYLIDEFKQLSVDRNEFAFVNAPHPSVELKCFSGEPQLEKVMENDYSAITKERTREEECNENRDLINYWIWEVWRHAIGPNIRELYPKLVETMNEGARRAGYANIGQIWQREMEIDDVEDVMRDLLNEIQPFYNMLHAFVKSVLTGKSTFDDNQSRNIPAHILGWNANWYHLLRDYIEPSMFPDDKWNVDAALDAKHWSSHDVFKRAEDFYTSMGLNKMSKSFWNKSYILGDVNTSCHGTAANMFDGDDFRIVVCGFKRLYDLYVIMHEMGHVEQYMMAHHKPAVFQPGNSVIQETIGDAIFLAAMTPMHLNRLKLIDDQRLFPTPVQSTSFDLHQLLIMALMKVPEIPFGFVIETFRYNLFAERIDVENSNDYFWELTRKYQRIEPPNVDINRHRLFDVASKFHFAANVPYARYFFANILQYQVFRGLCEMTVYGKVNGERLSMPLHKCDIYGSKRAGKLLRRTLGNGSEKTLTSILKGLTGSEKISARAMLEYYDPLIQWLQTYLDDNRIQY